MLPGIGGLNPKKMQAMMKQMGINQEDIEAERVTIEKKDGNIIIENPSVQKITMQGQESFQISGDIAEQTEEPSFSKEDINLIVEKTSCSPEEAEAALKETKDIVEAIEKLSN
jgi:nascent polypeptide-associated complex subunit alpha